MNKCAFGLTENQASGIAYLFGWVSGIILFVAEKDNKNVRFSALQSTILFGALSILTVVIQAIPIVRLLAGLVGLVTFVLWLYLMVSGFTGKKVVLPVLGDVCWEQVNK